MAEAAQRTLPARGLRVAIMIDDPIEHARVSALVLELGGMKREQVLTSIVRLKQSKPVTSREL